MQVVAGSNPDWLSVYKHVYFHFEFFASRSPQLGKANKNEIKHVIHPKYQKKNATFYMTACKLHVAFGICEVKTVWQTIFNNHSQVQFVCKISPCQWVFYMDMYNSVPNSDWIGRRKLKCRMFSKWWQDHIEINIPFVQMVFHFIRWNPYAELIFTFWKFNTGRSI